MGCKRLETKDAAGVNIGGCQGQRAKHSVTQCCILPRLMPNASPLLGVGVGGVIFFDGKIFVEKG